MKLNGTEKQIAWATTIIEETIKNAKPSKKQFVTIGSKLELNASEIIEDRNVCESILYTKAVKFLRELKASGISEEEGRKIVEEMSK